MSLSEKSRKIVWKAAEHIRHLRVLNQIIGLWPVDAKSVTGKTRLRLPIHGGKSTGKRWSQMPPSVRNMLLQSTTGSLPLLTNLMKTQTSMRSMISYLRQTKKSLWKKIKRSDPISDREQVQTARCVLKKASEAHYIRPTKGSLNRLEAARSALDNAYNKVIDEELRSKAEELESTHEESRHTAAWAALRELTIPQITYAGSESLLEEPSNKGRNLGRTSFYLQNCGSQKSKIRRPLLSCQRPGDLRSTIMETTLSKEGLQASHLSRHLGQGHGPYTKWTCPGNGR